MKNPHDVDLRDYKLIVFDIDGTLIGRNQALPAFTKDTLLRLRELGWDFTLATGKTLPATKDLADELEIDLPLILCNGGLIQRRSGEILGRISMPPEVTREIARICDERGQDLVLYIEDGLFVRKLTDNMLPIYGIVQDGLHEVGDWDALGERLSLTNKCVAIDTRPENKLDTLEAVFRAALNGRADMMRTSPELLDVVPHGVNKAVGLKKLVERLGIAMGEVMAFGDYDNDEPMLAAAGLGVVVAGATKAALESADIQVGSCEQEGPARFLAGLLKGMELLQK
jgi:hypothetical protein